MEKIVYRAGDFSRKAERIGSMSSGRGTGFFGTGYYFTTDWKKCAHLNDGERPLYSFDVSDYNLIYGTYDLHQALKNINRYVNLLPFVNLNLEGILNVDFELKKFTNTTYSMDSSSNFPKYFKRLCDECKESGDDYDDIKDFYINNILEALENVEELSGLYDILNSEDYPSIEDIEDYFQDKEDLLNYKFIENVQELEYWMPKIESTLDLTRNEIHSICKEIFEEIFEAIDIENFKYRLKVDENSDSITTRFLKKLGYEGVYPSEDCDNTTYGGIIFELDKIKDVKLLAKVAKEYKESKVMNKLRLFESIYENMKFEELWDKVQDKIREYNVDDKMEFIKEELKKEVDKFNNKDFEDDSEVLFKARVDTIFHRVGLVEKESEPLAFAIFDILVGKKDD